jgi:CelD/BcsL family acetyltransferase involved in cellulose biosynthesis
VTLGVEWVEDPAAFFSTDWDSLVEADPDGTFFHSRRFLKPYWEEFGAGRLLGAVVREGDETAAVAALEVRDRVLSFLGGFDVTDYMGPVGRPSARDRAAEELMAALSGRDDWDAADLRGLPEDGGWLSPLADAARDAGLSPDVGRDDVALLLRLPGSYQDYLAGLPGKRRHEIRRKDRRLREAAAEVRLIDATPDTAARDLDRFVELHRSSTGEKGKFMVPGMELFFRRLSDSLLPQGQVRLSFLAVDGERVAGAIGFRDGETFRLYNSAYDHSRSELGPGMVLVAELIRGAIAEGRRVFDFLTGDVRYKYSFGARPRRMARLRLRRS